MSSTRRPVDSGTPNILYLHCHDAGRYVQPYGYAIPTPHIQQLAEEGVLFRQAFCAAPTCSPSRACLLTGQWAHSNGMLGLAHRGFRLNDYSHHIVQILRGAVYASALAGMQHVASQPYADINEIGYDEILTTNSDFDAPTRAAEDYFARQHDRPFFLSVGYAAPHRAGEDFHRMYPPEDDRYLRPPDPLPDTPATRKDTARYQASVRGTDVAFGLVLAALERSGLAENTLVICTTDHGIAFPGMKCNLTDHGIGVLLIVRGPGGFIGGKVSDALVSQIDIAPTICELAAVAIPDWVQGRSLLPLIRGDAEEINDAIYAEVSHHAAYEPMRCVRTRRWKYIRRFDDRGKVNLPNCDDSPSKRLWYENGWTEQPCPPEALHDLVFDPHEVCNIIGRPDLAEVADAMRHRLDEWMRATNDPLLNGPIPLPERGVLTDAADYSPLGGWPENVHR
ncbi:MAG: sulfatase [Armatimonadetes bacterium CG2_30_59_28]|nr:sulfatase [Armatimonadota bacterium]OIO95878.1 MAG: sulfatase [Armatimonadetes bacterium CG2_30_59_28]PIU67422.1 MAG: sulfatase [Armatimonadetes bacterium CG07_land_8_20_14_0_80_59_28]PIY48848.1 MAG: sulfatase [Armatimonadetes bacterium CG_4_10_14_3_um_filter_59_10]PJB61746.1 MAG: sulfatase [Armatimonadetes bacterium CG_4_9_14_3_um_filter_58_7]